jgi:chromate transporter
MTIAKHSTETKDQRTDSPLEVLLVFLKLGVTCFGGPIAHIGYFHDEFVIRRRWIDEQAYADLVGLCQFLPGPASSPRRCRCCGRSDSLCERVAERSGRRLRR